MVRFVYTVVLVVGLLALTPVFALKALRHKKYLGSLRHRFGGAEVRVGDDPVLWIHAVSVGEVLAAEPLIRSAVNAFDGWQVVLSTTTATGQRLARERFPSLEVFYFPLDLPLVVDRTLDRVRPRVVCLVETEIWPNFLAACRRRGVRTVMANGRISDRSFRGYRRARGLLAPVLSDISSFLMQSEGDAQRIRDLGAPTDRVQVTGNLKYDLDRSQIEERLAAKREAVDRAFGLSESLHVIVAGSTTEGEEQILAEAFDLVRRHSGLERTRLLVAPRHPERFDEVERLFVRAGWIVDRRTRAKNGKSEGEVLLLDTIGELAAVYEFADAVFVGGSLVPRGGHNILEPALYARPVVVGPYTANFRQIVEDFVSADAVVQLEPEFGGSAPSRALADAVIKILTDREHAEGIGERAAAVLESNRGATTRTLDAMLTCIGTQPRGSDTTVEVTR